MKHCAKKLLGLAFALALCLAVGGTALAQTPEQEVLAYEQNVTTAAGTNIIDKLATEGYQVTIPTTVTVKSGENTGELEVTAQLKQWRTLNIGIESKKNNWKLAYDGATGADTPKVDYTLKNENENGGESTRDTIWYYDEDTHEIMYATSAVENFHTATIPLSVNVTNPSQATMSGTYSDTLTFTFNITKQSVTYTINVYEQKLELTNSGTHVQAVNVVDANGNVTDTTSVPKETYVLEYGCADAWGTPLATAVTSETWTRPRPSGTDGEEDTRCWEDLSRTLTPKADFNENVKAQTINLNLVRKWCWLDVNGITNKATCADCGKNGNQGSKIASFVNIKVSVDDGTNWSDWFWYPGGDDYWGTFPYGTEFQLGLHRVKDGYAYDEDASGNVAIYANGVLTHTQDTAVSPDGKTHYRVYQGKLKGEPVDETLHDAKGGGISHAAGSYPRYCYNVCFVDGITYYANGGTGGREDTNNYHGPHTTFKYTAGMTLADPLNDELTSCKFTAPAGKVFAGWSTTKDYTGQTLYGVGNPVSSVTWPARPSTSNNDTLPTGDGQTECRTLYAIWKKPYTVKVQFGGDRGWTTWDEATQSFPENKQDGDIFDTAIELGTAYAYRNASLTVSATENTAVWNALQNAINAETSKIAGAAQPEKVWQLKTEYTFNSTSAEFTIQIKRKRYLLNVIPALLQSDGSSITPAGDTSEAAQYGKFDLESCGRPQSLEGKFSYYQWMRNYGGSYRIYNVEATPGYQFAFFRVIESNAPVNKEGSSYNSTLTGKNSNIGYFGGNTTTYEGDTIYVVFKEDVVTFDYNGGTSDGNKKQVLKYDDGVYFPQVLLTPPKTDVDFVGWSTKQDPDNNAEIFKLAGKGGDVHPGQTTVSSKVTTWPDPNKKVLYAVWRSTTGPNRAPAKKVLTVCYHANFDPMEELALDLDPNPLLEDMDEDFGFDPDPLPEDVLDPTVEAVKTVTYKPDENVVLRPCMFKRGGYVFVGWNTEPDGTGKKYEVNGVPITDWAAGTTVDLYAQWKKPEHLKPVVDSEPFVPADPDTPPERVDDGFDADFGADPDPLPEGMDDAFGADPDPLPEGMDDAFGIDPDPLPEALDDAFGV